LTDTSGRVNTWDSQNRLVSCTKGGVTSSFTYGADGLRRSSTVNGITTYYAYDGTTMIRERKKNVNTGVLFNTATYLQGMRGTECRIDETQQTEGYYNPVYSYPNQMHARGVSKWYVYDGLGSVVGEVDVNGNLTSSPKYDVYGLTRSNPGSASSRQGFVGGLGHVTDTETGLIYMRARYYDPSIGRFESEDPGKHEANWFVYTSNNPVNKVDSTGKVFTDVLIGTGSPDFDPEQFMQMVQNVYENLSSEARAQYAADAEAAADRLDQEARGKNAEGLEDIAQGETLNLYCEGDEAGAGNPLIKRGGDSVAESAVMVLEACELRDLAQLVLGEE